MTKFLDLIGEKHNLRRGERGWERTQRVGVVGASAAMNEQLATSKNPRRPTHGVPTAGRLQEKEHRVGG